MDTPGDDRREESEKPFDVSASALKMATSEQEALRGVARKTLGNQIGQKVDASDIVQDALAAAWIKRGEFRGTSRTDFIGWIKSIVKNTALNAIRFFRTQRRGAQREERSPGDAQSRFIHANTPSASVIRREDAGRLRSVLDGLPEVERQTITMRYLEGMSLAEIAMRLGRTEAASAGVLKRGMRRLRDLMDKKGGE
jgi:RNA polymerase sigma-70 factor (ECF subfamily)